MEKCKWIKTRLNAAISWLKSRGLVKIEGKFIIGKRPSIDFFKHIDYKDTIRNWGIAQRCIFTGIDTLLLKRKKFNGRIFNGEESFDISLTASSDRSGKIVLNVEPFPRTLETSKQLLFVYSKMVRLDCTSTYDKNRKLTSDNVLIRFNDTEDSVPIWLETDKVVLTEEAKNTHLPARITLLLSEFDCLTDISESNPPPDVKLVIDSSDDDSYETVEMLPAPQIEGLGTLTLKPTYENNIKNRTNKRITACLSLTERSTPEDIEAWKGRASEFLKRLLSVLEFVQGGKLFCPVTEISNGNGIETTFLCHGESDQQFMPVAQRGKDLKTLIVKVIEKQKLLEDGIWKGIEEAISFALSAPSYGEIRLLANLIAIERLMKKFGFCKLGELESFLERKNISFIDIENGDIKKLIDTRNDLAHEGKFTGDKNDLAPILFCPTKFSPELSLIYLTSVATTAPTPVNLA